MVTTTLAEARADVGSTCSRDGNNDAGGGGRGSRLSLARVMAATILAEALADVGSTGLRDGNNDAGGGARGCRLSLARVKARLRCLGSIVGWLLLACWTATRAAKHTMAFACLIDGNDAGEAEDSV